MANTVIEQIKDRLPIAEVLGSYITLIPSGAQLKARCPFHNEKTPSFSVSPASGFYYCFGCGAKGDIFSFVERFEGLDFKGALKVLADRAGVALVYDPKDATDTTDAYEFMERITTKYELALQKNQEAQQYLKERGLTEETIKTFRIGYAPDEWQFISGGLSKEERTIAQDMGIVKEVTKDGQVRLYDRFRGRILFPIKDSSGRVIAFSGRIFPQTDEGPKYLNSPETPLFHKSKVLYGFDMAKGFIKKYGFSILVEGQMDIVLSHQHGFKNTIATSGTAVSAESAKDAFSHLAIVARLSPNIILAFDGDDAGIKATQKAALVAYSLGMNPKVITIPEQMDPADYLTKIGADAYKELLKHSTTYIESVLHCIPLASSPSAISRILATDIFPALAAIVSSVEQSQYIRIIAKELSIQEEAIRADFAVFLAQKKDAPETEVFVQETAKVKHPSVHEQLDALATFTRNDIVQQLYDEVKDYSFQDIRIAWPELSDVAMEYATVYIEREYGHLETKDFILLAQEFAQKIRISFLKSIKETLSQELLQKERSGDAQGADVIAQKIHELTKRMHEV